jgi:hypothetical protein
MRQERPAPARKELIIDLFTITYCVIYLEMHVLLLTSCLGDNIGTRRYIWKARRPNHKPSFTTCCETTFRLSLYRRFYFGVIPPSPDTRILMIEADRGVHHGSFQNNQPVTLPALQYLSIAPRDHKIPHPIIHRTLAL